MGRRGHAGRALSDGEDPIPGGDEFVVNRFDGDDLVRCNGVEVP